VHADGDGREAHGCVCSEICLDETKNHTSKEVCGVNYYTVQGAAGGRDGTDRAPNRSIKPSVASRKDTVSTPAWSTGTLAKDCPAVVTCFDV
jgi:hypothetical protein